MTLKFQKLSVPGDGITRPQAPFSNPHTTYRERETSHTCAESHAAHPQHEASTKAGTLVFGERKRAP